MSSSATDAASLSILSCSRTGHRNVDRIWRVLLQRQETKTNDKQQNSKYLGSFVKTSKYLLNGYRIDYATHFETAFLELHDRCVIDACSLREDQNWWIVRIGDVRTQTLRNGQSIFGFCTLEPDVRRCSGQCALQYAQKTAVTLANLVFQIME